MSLNCLICNQVLQRTVSGREYIREKDRSNRMRLKVERSWSGNITPSPPKCAQQKRPGGAVAKIKTDHRRVHSAGDVYPGSPEPRLVRSCGMRRDWSFEDLMTENQDKRVIVH